LQFFCLQCIGTGDGFNVLSSLSRIAVMAPGISRMRAKADSESLALYGTEEAYALLRLLASIDTLVGPDFYVQIASLVVLVTVSVDPNLLCQTLSQTDVILTCMLN